MVAGSRVVQRFAAGTSVVNRQYIRGRKQGVVNGKLINKRLPVVIIRRTDLSPDVQRQRGGMQVYARARSVRYRLWRAIDVDHGVCVSLMRDNGDMMPTGLIRQNTAQPVTVRPSETYFVVRAMERNREVLLAGATPIPTLLHDVFTVGVGPQTFDPEFNG